MDVEWLQIFFGSLYTIGLFVVGWILWRKGILRFRIGTYIGYSHIHTNHFCRAKYKFFNGSKHYYFRFPKESTIRLKYTVKVEKGGITVQLRNKEGELLAKLFQKMGKVSTNSLQIESGILFYSMVIKQKGAARLNFQWLKNRKRRSVISFVVSSVRMLYY